MYSFRLNVLRTCLAICLVSVRTLALPAQTNSFTEKAKQAQAARDEGKLDQALALYRSNLAVRPSWAEGWWHVGSIEYKLRHYDRADVAFQKLTALQPKNGAAWALMGLC